MHNHDNKQGGGNGMMWMMVLCCAIPLFLILVVGAGGKALGAPTWFVLGGIAGMVITHFFMMGKSHKHSDEDHEISGEGNKDSKDNKTHSGHGCCK